MERRVKYYTAQQAQLSLDRINALMPSGRVYLNEYLSEYDYYYIPVYEGYIDPTVQENDRVSYESLFTSDELKRVYDHNGVFSVINNPVANKDFKLGVDILHASIEIYGCEMSQAEVDSALTSYIDNYENIQSTGVEFSYLHIGGNEDYPDLANSTPSAQVINDINELAKNEKLQVNYWNGSKNVSLPNSQIEVITNNDYEIQEVKTINSNSVSVDHLEEGQNAFYVSKGTFETFATLMNNQRYAESPFRVCVVFNDNLTIKEVYSKPEQGTEISLNGYNLAYAPLDFFMQAIVLPSLGDPVMDVWNSFITVNSTNQEKVFRIFPEIDLTPLEI